MTRWVFLTIGLLFTAIGIAGAFLPLVPTVSPLLVALWCFSRSSRRFHDWLFFHPTLGPPLQRWRQYRVIPNRAKLLACTGMTISLAILIATTDYAPWVYIAIAATLTAIATWITTRPGAVPQETDL